MMIFRHYNILNGVSAIFKIFKFLNFISQLEGHSAPYVPSLKSLFKISNALGVSVNKLVDVENDFFIVG